MAKHRVPRKKKKELKKRYKSLNDYVGKTTMRGITSDGCWILPNHLNFHDFAKYE